MSYLLYTADDDEEPEEWEIVFWTRQGQSTSIELEGVLDQMTDAAAARLLLAVGEFAKPPREQDYYCGFVEGQIEVYVMPVFGLQNDAFLLFGAHLAAQKIYILGVEDRPGQSYLSANETAKAEALRLYASLNE